MNRILLFLLILILRVIDVFRLLVDVHCLVQLASAKGGHADREHRGGLSERSQTDAAARDHQRRAATEARPRQDANPQAVERQQSAAIHRE